METGGRSGQIWFLSSSLYVCICILYHQLAASFLTTPINGQDDQLNQGFNDWGLWNVILTKMLRHNQSPKMFLAAISK